MTQNDISVLKGAHKDLKNAISNYGIIGILSDIAERESCYWNVINSIQNGLGNITRPEKENAADVLAELREEYTPITNDINSRIYFICCIAELMENVERINSILDRIFPSNE